MRRDKDSEPDCTDIWREYQAGLDYFNSINLFGRTQDCYNFVNGEQWEGLDSGDEKIPQLNFLSGLMKQATALVGQNTMAIHYTSLNYGSSRQALLEACDQLNRHAARMWERVKLDRLQWDVLQDAFICGDSIAYFYDADDGIRMELLDNVNVMFADEQNPDIQSQPYILIVQRKPTTAVQDDARRYGASDDVIDLITPDDDKQLQLGGATEVEVTKKTTTVLKLWKEDGTIYIARSARNAVYQPKTRIDGLTLYPIAKYSWKLKKGRARGLGDIYDKIPNQISVNKNLYRFETAVKNSAYPHKVYDSMALENPELLQYPDSAIAVQNVSGRGVGDLVAYLQPANISPYARTIWQDMVTQTRELAGAGDNLENINPENASGAAINAALQAKALNVNMQVAAFKQFIEDIALIWYDMWVAYNPNGLAVETKSPDGITELTIIPSEVLRRLKIDVRIDVSPTNPYSKLAQETSLQELFAAGAITFEEFVKALDEDSLIPKAKLEEILQRRKQAELEAQQAQMEQALLASLAPSQTQTISPARILQGQTVTPVQEVM